MKINITDIKVERIVIYPTITGYIVDTNYVLLDDKGNEVAKRGSRFEKSDVAKLSIPKNKEHIIAFQDSVKEHLLNKEKI